MPKDVIDPPSPPTAPPTEPSKGQRKTARIPIPIKPITMQQRLPKPNWIRVKAAAPTSRFQEIKHILRAHRLNTVCEEASCPNIGECFGKGTATFMIMGSQCTRRCTFCDIAHGRPDPLDEEEPQRLAETVAELALQHVVITSVDRDDLRDGGAQHFVDCITWIRRLSPGTRIEILVPDFRGRLEKALRCFAEGFLPDIFSHNLETIERLYRAVRPGSDYTHSLTLLQAFKKAHPHVLTKCSVMVGLGENDEELLSAVRDIRAHDVDMLAIGQYLQPSLYHAPVERYVPPDTFQAYQDYAYTLGFVRATCGPLVRSSYHADEQAPQ